MNKRQQHYDEAYRHMEEAPWDDMSKDEIATFLHLHPTYFMGPKEASDWYAGVDRAIRKDKERHYHGSDSDHRMVGGQLYTRGAGGYYVNAASNIKPEGRE